MSNQDEAVAEPIEDEEVTEVEESVDADDDEEATEVEVAESEDAAKEEEEPEPSESSTEKKDDGFQKRIDELTQRYYTEKQQRERYQQQWEDSQKVEIPLEPGKTLADFEYDESKFAEYVQGQAVADAKAELERGNRQQAEIEQRAKFGVKEDAFAEKVSDYQSVTRNQNLAITDTMVQTLQTAEKGPEVLYYLGKNPEVAASLSGMHPLDAAREIGRIEATKLVAPEPSTKKPPAAVPKIKAVDSGANRVRSDTPESDKLSTAEWKRREIKRMANRNK